MAASTSAPVRRSPLPFPEPQSLEFKRLSTFDQLGLRPLLDCKGAYFLINLAGGVVLLGFLFAFVILLNHDSNGENLFDQPGWKGDFNGTIACEDRTLIAEVFDNATADRPFVLQPINAATCFFYVIIGVLLIMLGMYDRESWKERAAIWEETHEKLPTGARKRSSIALEPVDPNAPANRPKPRRYSSALSNQVNSNSVVVDVNGSVAVNGAINGRLSNTRASRASLPRSVVSAASARSRGTIYSVEHLELTERRRFNEYLLGKSGAASLVVRQPLWSFLLGFCLIFIGFTGFIYHASITLVGKTLDDFALWVNIVDLCAIAWARYFSDGFTSQWPFTKCKSKIPKKNAAGVLVIDNPIRSSFIVTVTFLIISAGFDFLFFSYSDEIDNRDYFRAALIAALVVFAIPLFLHFTYNRKKIGSAWTLLVISMFFLLAGFLFNEGDVPDGILCLNDTGFQFHSLWHVCSAFGVLCVYLFFRSDFYLKDAPIDEENSPRLLTDLDGMELGANSTSNQAAMQSQMSPTGVRRQQVREYKAKQKTQLLQSGTASQNNFMEEEEVQVQNLRPSGPGSFHSAGGSVPSLTRNSKTRVVSRPRTPASIPGGVNLTPTVISLDADNRSEQMSFFPGQVEFEIQKMWSCANCGYSENNMNTDSACKQCKYPRPALEQLVPLYSNQGAPLIRTVGSMTSRSKPAQNLQNASKPQSMVSVDAQSVPSTQVSRTGQRKIPRVANRPPSNTRIPPGSVGTAPRASNPRIMDIKTNDRQRASNPRIRNTPSRGSNPGSTTAPGPLNQQLQGTGPRTRNSRPRSAGRPVSTTRRPSAAPPGPGDNAIDQHI